MSDKCRASDWFTDDVIRMGIEMWHLGMYDVQISSVL